MLRCSKTRAACAVAGLAVSLSSVAVADGPVLWQNQGVAAVGQIGTPVDQLDALRGESDRRVVVRFNEALLPEEREALEARGLRVLNFLGSNTYFATVSPDADAAAIAARSPLSGAQPVTRAMKLHEDLLAGDPPVWSITNDRTKAAEDAIRLGDLESAAAMLADPEVAVLAIFHPDASRDAFEGVVAQAGGRVISTLRSMPMVVVHMPLSEVGSLADHDSVQWVQPPLPRLTENNDANRAITGVDVVNSAPYGLDGSGVTVMVFDGGTVRTSHSTFGGRARVGQGDSGAGVSDHGTHVAGTIGGNGGGSSGNQHRGMAPGVEIVSYEFAENGLPTGFLYTDPADLEEDYLEAFTLEEAHLSNNSIGSNTEPNGFDCSWQGDYGPTAALIDTLVRGDGAIPFPIRVVWAAGNERQGSRCDVEGFGDFYSTAPPAGAKNHLAIGALNANDDSMTSFSSWGPTDDGRLKPDFSGPGCQSGGDSGVTSSSGFGDSSYNVKCGTSMSSPTVAGIAALMLQAHRMENPSAPDPRNSTLKAILANSAVDVFNPGPDYMSGYGSVRATHAVDTIQAGRYLENSVGAGETRQFFVLADGTESQLRVTMAWDDPAGAPNVIPSLVNDLDIVIYDPSGNPVMPWVLDPANPGADATRGVDRLNNIEQVAIDNPQAGAYLVEVSGFAINSGVEQVFSAAANADIINCSDEGFVSVGGSLFQCEDTLGLTVVDCGLNTSDSVIDSVSIHVASDTDPVGVMVTLNEVDPVAATFVASLPISASGGAGALAVSPGDTVTATYMDADDGMGGMSIPRTSTATIDCTAPIAQSIAVSEVNPTDATLAITLSEPGGVNVRFGTSPFDLSESVGRSISSSTHEIQLRNLTFDTEYFFAVDATDQAGNMSTALDGGSPFSFSTPDVPNYFTEEFGGDNDVEGLIVSWTPSDNEDGYEMCVEPLVGGLPQPATGSTVPLSDDDSELVGFGGQTFEFYGVTYTNVWVGSNGYLTFGAGDTDYTESVADHFSQPRVSMLFDDLNPSSGGTVRSQVLADRAVVTYSGVPQFSNSDNNTFQVQLVFATGEIIVAWQSVGASDGIVGLSSGSFIESEFFEINVSDTDCVEPCQADWDGSGSADVFDILAFLDDWDNEDPAADLNDNGSFDVFDILAFLGVWDAGCP